jgi:hypothetical protein
VNKDLGVGKRRGVATYENNPFVPAVHVRSKRVTNKRGNMSLVDNDTGAIATSIAGFWETEEVDTGRFIKLFINGVKALKELTNAGTKVFEILYLEMQNNLGKDKVYLSYTTLNQQLTPMSESTYARGMRELTSKGFIAASNGTNLYWVNPDYLWNGDRLTFVKQFYKKDSDKQVSEQKEGLTASKREE